MVGEFQASMDHFEHFTEDPVKLPWTSIYKQMCFVIFVLIWHLIKPIFGQNVAPNVLHFCYKRVWIQNTKLEQPIRSSELWLLLFAIYHKGVKKFLYKFFRCRDGPIKRMETRQRQKNTQEHYPTTETWWKRKRHKAWAYTQMHFDLHRPSSLWETPTELSTANFRRPRLRTVYWYGTCTSANHDLYNIYYSI